MYIFTTIYIYIYIYIYNSLTHTPVWQEDTGACLASPVLFLKPIHSLNKFT